MTAKRVFSLHREQTPTNLLYNIMYYLLYSKKSALHFSIFKLQQENLYHWSYHV